MFRTRYDLFKILYALCIVLAAIYCFKRPFYNWDMLPYTNLILRMDHHNPEEAYNLTYQLAKNNIPSNDFQKLTDSLNVYRYAMSHNPVTFNEQLPYYVIKPLYISLTYLFYKSGISLPQATLVPSFISYLLIGFLLFHWLGPYLRLPVRFLTALLMMISPPLLEVAKLSTPDCLSAFLLLSSFYFIIEKPSLWLTVIFMILAVFARLDNIVTCLTILSVIFASKKWYKKVSLRIFSLVIILFVFSYLLIGLFAYQYGWSMFFYNDFASHLHPMYGSKEQFFFGSYLRLMYEHALSGIKGSYLAVFLAIHVLNFNQKLSFRELSFDKLFALLIPVILFLRFILYPDVSDRFYGAFYITIIILLVKNVTSRGR